MMVSAHEYALRRALQDALLALNSVRNALDQRWPMVHDARETADAALRAAALALEDR